MSNSYETDIIIVGAGPVGLFTIFEAGMLNLKCHVIDSLEFVGGQCSALYPEKPIFDIPGHPEILAQHLVDNLAKQAEPFSPVYHLNQTMISLKQDGKYWVATTSKGSEVKAKAIIIAAGCGNFGPNRPPMERLEEYEGKSVFYMVGKKDDMAGKNVVIAGGGDSAVDWALSLADVAKKVFVVHRRPKFRCAPESYNKMQQLANAEKIELVIPYQLDSLEGNAGVLKKVIVKTLEGEKKEIDADILLPFFGLSMELGPIANWGLNLHKNLITVNHATMETSVKGIFAVGDIITYENKLKLILNGFAEAATACHSARKHLFPGEELHFEYSTTKGVPASV